MSQLLRDDFERGTWGNSAADTIAGSAVPERIALMVSNGADFCAPSATGKISSAHQNIVNASGAIRLRRPRVNMCTTLRV